MHDAFMHMQASLQEVYTIICVLKLKLKKALYDVMFYRPFCSAFVRDELPIVAIATYADEL
jgi:hypothetical protein